MDVDQLNNWITLGANIGILVGLILVGFQIRQNSALVRAQIIATAFSDKEALAIAKMGEDYPGALARSIEEPTNVTLADVAALESALEAQLVDFRRNAIMEEIGVFSGRWRGDIPNESLPFTTPVGRRYWNHWYDDKIDWMREVQGYIESSGQTRKSDDLDKLRKSLISDQHK